MKLKRASLLTKLLVLVLLVCAVTAFLDLRAKEKDLRAQQAALEQQTARQRQENAELAAAIAEKDDPDRIADVARDRLGMVAPGEIVFFDSGN